MRAANSPSAAGNGPVHALPLIEFMAISKSTTHAATGHPASTATKAEHSYARFADRQRRSDVRADMATKRVWIIGAVVGAGVLAWLFANLG